VLTGCIRTAGGGSHLSLGPPKTPAAVRDILLPPLLVDLLRTHLAEHGHEHVFIGRHGGLLRRSSFHRRSWRPAVEKRLVDGLQRRWSNTAPQTNPSTGDNL
jgi:hypothetical protein